MQDVLAKLKEIQENYDNEDIQRAINAAEKIAVAEEETVEEANNEVVDEAEQAVEEDSVEEVHEEEVVEESTDNSDLERMIKLSGRSGVMGMNTNVIVAESVEVAEDEVSEGFGPPSNGAKNIQELISKMGADTPGDIIADIMHWADENDMEFSDLVKQGTMYYNDEKMMYSDNDDSEEEVDEDEVSEEAFVAKETTDEDKDEEVDESFETVEEEAVEETIEVPVSALQELMKLAGYEQYKIDEYANEPEEEYSSAEDQMDLGGGLNGPKKAYAAAAGGDNPMDQEPTEIEEDNKLTFEGMYKRYMTQVVEESLEEKE